ncbi:hypothetical protein MBANPS3_004856 [Mucor bainieri]
MAQDNKETLEKRVVELTKQLEANSTDNKATAQTLLQRAQVYESLDQITHATNDVQTALKRDPQVKAEATELLSRFNTHTQQQQQAASSTEEDPRVASFQKHLANLETLPDVTSIRRFVGSSDFVLVLTACGTPDTPPRIKSLAFMILTRLFNPPQANDMKSYPMTYIIEQCAACFSHCMDQGKNETKLLAYRTLTALFQTSMTVGSAILCQEGTVEEIMDVVEFETLPVQLAIAEVLTIASSDKTCRKQIMTYAVDWLVKMAGQSKTDPQLKAAAGTALTKLRAQADLPTDADDATTASSNITEATPTLEDAMRKMNLTNDTLINSLKDVIKSKSSDASLVLNAVEGLAYACLKPDVKASLGDDDEFLKCLSTLTISTARQDTASSNPLLFGIGTILANLTMYRPVLDDHQKQMKKLRDLANAKQRQAAASAGATAAAAQQKQLQEEKDDPREDDKAVEERIKRAVQQGAAMALMVLSKNSSVNIRAVAAQTYLNLVTPQATRGQLLQQGIVKGLLPLSRDTTTSSSSGVLASQALAKLAITTDPRIAFVGDTILDLVRPLLALCKDTAQLRQFEGLMALTNLASVDDRVRQLIEHAEGMAVFENLQLSNNDMVQRAATEMVCNMTFCDPVFERYSDPTKSQNRIRLLMILSDHEDPSTRRAASGALAILANSPSTCDMILKVDKCYERMARWLSLEETVDVQHRGIEVLRCLIQHKGKPVVDALVSQAGADKLLVALVKQCQVQPVRSAAMEVLKIHQSPLRNTGQHLPAHTFKVDLSHCQLVCKAWSRAAQTFLYKTFDVDTSSSSSTYSFDRDLTDPATGTTKEEQQQQRKLRSFVRTLQHLAPHVGPFVKKISLKYSLLYAPDAITVLTVLFDACRNMEEFYCAGDSTTIAWPLLLMLPDNQVSKIRAIVDRDRKATSPLYAFVALKLKRSLTELQWTLDDSRHSRSHPTKIRYTYLAQQLPQFTSLQRLYFPICRFSEYRTLCQVIDACGPTVTELAIDLYEPLNVIDEQAAKSIRLVKPNHSIDTIRIQRAILERHMITYLATKFPKLKRLEANFSRSYFNVGCEEMPLLSASLDSFELYFALGSRLYHPSPEHALLPVVSAAPKRILSIHFMPPNGMGRSVLFLSDPFDFERDLAFLDDDDDDADNNNNNNTAFNSGLVNTRNRLENRMQAEFRNTFTAECQDGVRLIKDGETSRMEMCALDPKKYRRDECVKWIKQYAPQTIRIANMGHLKRPSIEYRDYNPSTSSPAKAFKKWLQEYRSDHMCEERNQRLLAGVLRATVDAPNTTIHLADMVVLGAVSGGHGPPLPRTSTKEDDIKRDDLVMSSELSFVFGAKAQNCNIKELRIAHSLFTHYVLVYISNQVPVLDTLILDTCCIFMDEDHTCKVLLPHTRLRRLGMVIAPLSPLHYLSGDEITAGRQYLSNTELMDALSSSSSYTLKVETKAKTYICKKKGDETLPGDVAMAKGMKVGTKDNFLLWIVCQELQELSIVNGANQRRPIVHQFRPLEV